MNPVFSMKGTLSVTMDEQGQMTVAGDRLDDDFWMGGLWAALQVQREHRRNTLAAPVFAPHVLDILRLGR